MVPSSYIMDSLSARNTPPQMGPGVGKIEPRHSVDVIWRVYLEKMQEERSSWIVAFALIYMTFFLDNVLLTVLVPIIPDWVRGSSLAAWGAHGAAHGAPLARVLNATVHGDDTGVGGSQALVGLVLSAKAVAQLGVAGPAAAAVCRRGPAAPLRAGTLLMLLAALIFAWCSRCDGGAGGWVGSVGAGVGRAAQGAGAALCGVAGLTLASSTAPPRHKDNVLGALLGAVALGVLVGYPFGGATYALWSREAPFLIIAAAVLATLVMQYQFLRDEEFNRPMSWSGDGGAGGAPPLSALSEAHVAPCGACAGAVLLTTSVMAALEPCLPFWIMQRFHPQKWVTGAVFIPDSAAYAVAASTLGGVAGALGAERLALAGQLAVGLAALALPHATSVGALVGPHCVLGAGLGAVDAALVPALLARQPGRAPHRAALLQAAASGAYALGPVLGGLVSWTCGFETTLRALGVLNLLYAAFLCRALNNNPLSKQWGALSEDSPECSELETGTGELSELAPLRRPPKPAPKRSANN